MGKRAVRFSLASSEDNIREAARRLRFQSHTKHFEFHRCGGARVKTWFPSSMLPGRFLPPSLL